MLTPLLIISAYLLAVFALIYAITRPRKLTQCRECHRLCDEWHRPTLPNKRDTISREYYICPQCCSSLRITR